MTTVREPRLKPVAILDLRPTQFTVGMREVKAKRKHWRDERKKRDEYTKKVEEFLGKHMIPVILGPKGRYYVIDHHHLARALHDEGVKDVAVTVIANLSKLDRHAFWFVMDNRDWTHPFDADGRRRPYSDMPKSVDKLTTIRSVHSQVNCDGRVASPRIRRHSANSFGPTFYGAA